MDAEEVIGLIAPELTKARGQLERAIVQLRDAQNRVATWQARVSELEGHLDRARSDLRASVASDMAKEV